MADAKISQLPVATSSAGTDVLPIVQSSTTKQLAIQNLVPQNLKSNATTGVLQVIGPAAGATRVMTVPNANFTAARTDAGQTFTGNQAITGDFSNTGAATLASTADGQIIKVSNNYYQIKNYKLNTISSNLPFLKITLPGTSYNGLIVRTCATAYRSGDNVYAAVYEWFVYGSDAGPTATIKLANNTGGDIVSIGVSGADVTLSYIFGGIPNGWYHSYTDIMGMSAYTSAEKAFTVTIL